MALFSQDEQQLILQYRDVIIAQNQNNPLVRDGLNITNNELNTLFDQYIISTVNDIGVDVFLPREIVTKQLSEIKSLKEMLDENRKLPKTQRKSVKDINQERRDFQRRDKYIFEGYVYQKLARQPTGDYQSDQKISKADLETNETLYHKLKRGIIDDHLDITHGNKPEVMLLAKGRAGLSLFPIYTYNVLDTINNLKLLPPISLNRLKYLAMLETFFFNEEVDRRTYGLCNFVSRNQNSLLVADGIYLSYDRSQDPYDISRFIIRRYNNGNLLFEMQLSNDLPSSNGITIFSIKNCHPHLGYVTHIRQLNFGPRLTIQTEDLDVDSYLFAINNFNGPYFHGEQFYEVELLNDINWLNPRTNDMNKVTFSNGYLKGDVTLFTTDGHLYYKDLLGKLKDTLFNGFVVQQSHHSADKKFKPTIEGFEAGAIARIRTNLYGKNIILTNNMRYPNSYFDMKNVVAITNGPFIINFNYNPDIIEDKGYENFPTLLRYSVKLANGVKIGREEITYRGTCEQSNIMILANRNIYQCFEAKRVALVGDAFLESEMSDGTRRNQVDIDLNKIQSTYIAYYFNGVIMTQEDYNLQVRQYQELITQQQQVPLVQQIINEYSLLY
jgi:hypothetical protein